MPQGGGKRERTRFFLLILLVYRIIIGLERRRIEASTYFTRLAFTKDNLLIE